MTSRPAEGPPFAYTTGLFGLGHPELLVFGLNPHDAAGLLNCLGDRVKEGEALLPGIEVTVGEWPHRVVPEEVPDPGEIVFEANRFYQRPSQATVPVLQLSYDDDADRSPGTTVSAIRSRSPDRALSRHERRVDSPDKERHHLGCQYG